MIHKTLKFFRTTHHNPTLKSITTNVRRTESVHYLTSVPHLFNYAKVNNTHI